MKPCQERLRFATLDETDNDDDDHDHDHDHDDDDDDDNLKVSVCRLSNSRGES